MVQVADSPDPIWGSPFLMVPSFLHTMSWRRSPTNWTIQPQLPRKKQLQIKNRITAGYRRPVFQSMTNVSNVKSVDIIHRVPATAIKICTALCSPWVKRGFRHWIPQPLMSSYQLDSSVVRTSGAAHVPVVLKSFCSKYVRPHPDEKNQASHFRNSGQSPLNCLTARHGSRVRSHNSLLGSSTFCSVASHFGR